MASLPGANVTTTETAGAAAGGLDTVCVLMPVKTSADAKPRLFGSANAVFEQHGYSEGLEYCALHAQLTRKPFMVVGLPIVTAGVIGREDVSGNSGSCATTVTAGSGGVMAEHDGILSVITGGTIGSDQIKLGLSLDGGRTTKTIRLGTGNSYSEPYFNFGIGFGAGSLVTGDTIHTWHGSAPRSDATGWAAARTALAAQQKAFRTMVLIGDLQNSTEAGDFLAQVNAYKTANQRSTTGRASVLDRMPLATASAVVARMAGNPNVTFLEVGVSGDTITRASGSFVTDGFANGDIISVTGSVSNNVTGAVATVAASVLTLGSTDLANEGPVGNVTITATPALTFAAGTTITRSRGSWLDDGFRVGQTITITGSVSNNVSAVITTLTATVLTASATTFTGETIGMASVTITAGQTKAAWMAAVDAAFASIDANRRENLSAGRGRVRSAFTPWYMRRPAGWFASWREYQHDVHIPSWRKADGPVGADLFDAEGNLVEWDDRVDGGAGCAARFTTLRTWANGPGGGFVTLDLTRAGDNSILSMHHNANVVNVAETVCQIATEEFIGRTPQLNADGTLTQDERSALEGEINAALENNLLKDKGEKPRCSLAVWTASTNDVLNVPDAMLTGVLTLNLNGTIVHVDTTIRVLTGGQS